MNFRPERHIDPSSGRFKQCARTISFFGIGRRRCPGENLARAQLYLFFVALVQHFKFSVPVGRVVDLEKASAKGLLIYPKPFDLVIDPLM
jgi:cytochrome P450 family 2 subfamily J